MVKPKKGAAKKAAPKKPEPTVTVAVKYLKEVYNDVCEEWQNRLEDKFPEILGRGSMVGEEFEGEDTGYTYVIAETGNNIVALINRDDNYKLYSKNIKVKSVDDITGEELKKLKDSLEVKETLRRA